MNINLEQLEINVNLHSLQPGFLNSEVHYIIASSVNNFRFAAWDEMPGKHEQKFYCFLMERKLFIPAGNIVLKESYVLTDKPIYPLASSYSDFAEALEKTKDSGI